MQGADLVDGEEKQKNDFTSWMVLKEVETALKIPSREV